MKSRDSSLIPSLFPGVLCPAIPGCWLRAGRCKAPPSSHAGCVVPLALGMHSQPGNRPLQPCTSPSAGCVAGVASLRHRPRPPVPASGGAQCLSQMGSFQMGQICLGKAERGEKGVKVNHSPGRLEVEPV